MLSAEDIPPVKTDGGVVCGLLATSWKMILYKQYNFRFHKHKTFLTSVYLLLCDTSSGRESTRFSDERRSAAVTLLLKSRSLSLRLTACPKQMGDSGNWHRGLSHAVMALSPEMLHLYLSPAVFWSACSCLAAKVKRDPSLSATQAHKVLLGLDFKDIGKPLLQNWSNYWRGWFTSHLKLLQSNTIENI